MSSPIKPVARATIRVYTESTNFSDTNDQHPGECLTDLFFKFDDFVADAGGTGGRLHATCNAIELEINSTVDAMDGEVELIEAIGYNCDSIVDFDNFFESDLSLTKIVDNATPNVGDQVTFTDHRDQRRARLGPERRRRRPAAGRFDVRFGESLARDLR